MTTYTEFHLNEIEQACGVTLDDVARELPRALLRDDFVIVPSDISPALAGAVARCALDSKRVEFDGFALGNYARYIRGAKHGEKTP
jgi:hypothetical protein